MPNLHQILLSLAMAACASNFPFAAMPSSAFAQPPSTQQAPPQQATADGEAAYRSAVTLFEAAQSNGKWNDAIRAFENFQSRFPQHPKAIDAPFNIAEAQIQLGEFEKARTLLLDYSALQLSDAQKALTLYRIGECSFFLNEYDRAHKDLETFRSLYPNHEKDPYAIAYLGDILLSPTELNVAEAKALFQEAINKYNTLVKQANPKDPAALKRLQLTVEESKLGLGRAQAAGGETPAAISTFKKMADDPKGPLAGEARVRLGRVYYDGRRFDEAITSLKPFEKAAKSANKNWGLYWLGRTYLDRAAKGDDVLAFAALKTIHIAENVPEEPPVPAVIYYLGEAYRAGGQLDNALSRFEKAFLDYPESEWADDAFLGAMRVALEKLDFRKVTIEYQSTASEQFSASPLYPYMEQLFGQAFLKNESYNDAQTIFAKLTQKYTSSAEPTEEGALPVAFTNDNWLFLALSEIGLRRADKALAALKNITPSKDPSDDFDMAVNAAAANANVLQERYREAIAPLQEYLKIRGGDSDAPRYYELLALCQIMDKQSGAAQRTIDTLRKLDPESIGGVEPILKAEKKLAVAAVQQNEKELARNIYTSLTFRDNPRPYIAFGEEGLALLSSGRVPTSVDAKNDSPVSERVDAQRAFALFQEGIQAEELGDNEKALENFVTVYTDHRGTPEAPKALLAAGRILDRGGKDKEAAQLLQKLVQEYRDFPQLDLTYYRLGWTLVESGDIEGGQTAFRRLVDDHAQSSLWADAAYRVAEFESASDHRDVANPLLDDILRQSATAQNPTRLLDHVLYLRGQNAFLDGSWTASEKYMKQLIEETPNSPLALSAQYWLAEAAYKGRDWQTAQKRFTDLETEAAGRNEPWLPIIPLRQAQILAWTKKWPQAYDAAVDIKRAYPTFERMHEVDYLIGRCFTQAGNFTEARKSFAQVIDADNGQRSETSAMAQWMIGETHFRQKDYDKAINAYDKVQGQYRHPYWQAVALLQIGKCYLQKGEAKNASAAFADLLRRFPNSAYAEKAETLRKSIVSGAAATRSTAARYR